MTGPETASSPCGLATAPLALGLPTAPFPKGLRRITGLPTSVPVVDPEVACDPAPVPLGHNPEVVLLTQGPMPISDPGGRPTNLGLMVEPEVALQLGSSPSQPWSERGLDNPGT